MSRQKTQEDWGSRVSEEGEDETQVNPGTKPNASPPKPPHANPDAIEHGLLRDAGPAKQEGGRDESQVSAPTVSLHPTSQSQGDANAEVGEHRIIDAVNLSVYGSVPEAMQSKFKYP